MHTNPKIKACKTTHYTSQLGNQPSSKSKALHSASLFSFMQLTSIQWTFQKTWSLNRNYLSFVLLNSLMNIKQDCTLAVCYQRLPKQKSWGEGRYRCNKILCWDFPTNTSEIDVLSFFFRKMRSCTLRYFLKCPYLLSV